MKYFLITLIYTAFFSLIGIAIWLTNSAVPLWALLLVPTIKFKVKKEKRAD